MVVAFRVTPKAGKKIIAVRKLKGMAIAVSAALRKPIVNQSRPTTRTTPVTRLSTRIPRRPVTKRAVSKVFAMVTPSGSLSRWSWIHASTEATRSTTSASERLVMVTSRAGLPS